VSARASRRPRRWYIVRGGAVVGWARTRPEAVQRGGPRSYIVSGDTKRTALHAAKHHSWA
jgi:hypothetical protein